MKRNTLHTLFVICLIFTVAAVTGLNAQDNKSRLNNDPDVVYLDEYIDKPIQFIALEALPIYSTKKGASSRRLGYFKTGDSLQLVAMTDTAYRVSGKGKHGKITGWVNPKKLANKDPKFVENLKYLYDRQMLITQLIANQEVAIGMTIKEVSQSLGEPTKKTSKVTKNGRSGSWEFITYEEQKHFNYITDPNSGQVYRRLSHVSNEEKSKVSVEFEDDVVTSVTTMEDNGLDKVRIVNPPLIFGF